MAWDSGEEVPKLYQIDENFIYEKMIYDLCQLFYKDPIYIAENYTLIDYFTYITFKLNQNAYEKYIMDKK